MSSPRITYVSYDEFSSYTFEPPATWFIRDATGVYAFIHTADRAKAQGWVDEEYGKGRYTVNASKIQKKQRTGEGSKPAFGVATRRGQQR